VRYRFEQYELSREHRLLTRHGEQVVLSAKAFEILCELITNRGEVVTKEELLDRVWPNQFVEENNLTVQISGLRKALGGSGQLIATVPGRGYSFVGDVENVDDQIIVEHRIIDRISVEAGSGDAPSRVRWYALPAVIAIAIALAGFAGYRYLHTPVPKITSVAVLPFTNDTLDANNEYLSDGIAENVTYSLSQLPSIRVMSRNSSFRYKGSSSDAATIGNELKVDAILTGHVSQRGSALNISSELISTSDNSVIWGQKFSRQLADVEKLQSDIAGSIMSKLRFKLTGIQPRMTENAEAYKKYLLGLYHWNRRTPDDIAKSIELFKAAIDDDPQFSRAYGGLAMAYEVQDSNGAFTRKEGRAMNARAQAAAEKALEMDENLAEAHAVLAMRRFRGWDFEGAEVSIKRAIEINPNFATAYQWYAELLSSLGRFDESIEQIERAYELDPYSRAVIMNVGLRYFAARRTDDAIAQFRRLTETEPDYPMAHQMLGIAYEEKGMLLDALDPFCRADALLKVDPPELCEKDNQETRALFQREGVAGYWRKNLEINQRFAKRGIVDEVWSANAYLRVGDKERAFQLLEEAFANHSPELVQIKSQPPFRDLAGDPRYEDLLRRIGLSK
jgi:TolB-like protein/DNA-binding winged helix-turn-helix (wHTH) protein/Tfp pilus assembly protein PilF